MPKANTKLPNLMVLTAASIVFLIIHAVEEYRSGFPEMDRSFGWIVHTFRGMQFDQAVFILYQIALILALIVIFAVVFVRFSSLVLLVLIGLILIFESTHIIAAIFVGGYYPGLYTAFISPILSVLYWLRLIFDFRSRQLPPTLGQAGW